MCALESDTEAEVAHQVSIQDQAALALVQDRDQDSAAGSGPAVDQQALAAATTSTECPVSDLVASILEYPVAQDSAAEVVMPSALAIDNQESVQAPDLAAEAVAQLSDPVTPPLATVEDPDSAAAAITVMESAVVPAKAVAF